MAGNDKSKNAATELSLDKLQSLDPQLLKELHNKFGLEVQVRSNSEAINEILKGLGESGGIGAQAEFTRGFDRTSPGYDKYYNRDFKQRDPFEEVILPADRLKNISLADALKTLSAEQLGALKKQQG